MSKIEKMAFEALYNKLDSIFGFLKESCKYNILLPYCLYSIPSIGLSVIMSGNRKRKNLYISVATSCNPDGSRRQWLPSKLTQCAVR